MINVKGFKCNHCGWIWLSRQYLEDGKTIPVACAHCKSPYWNRTTENKKEKKKENKKKK